MTTPIPPEQLAETSAERLTAEEREWVRLAEAAPSGDWTVNDRALAPVTWPDDATHLSDVAFALLNVEHDDRDACVAALVFAAAARTALPAALEELARARRILRGIVGWDENPALGNAPLYEYIREAKALLAEAGIGEESARLVRESEEKEPTDAE